MQRIGLWGMAIWLGLVLACNAPITEPTSPPPPDDNSDSDENEVPAGPSDSEADEPTATTEPSATLSPEAEEGEPAEPEASHTPLPTFTPIQQPTLASTPTNVPTGTPRPTSSSGGSGGSSATSTPVSSSSGPLTLEYNVSWALDPSDPFKAIATVNLTASGGSGVYTYYHDELPVAGPMFTYEWGACRGNPGSFRVDSTDGQSIKIDYFENPPCPTPTPQS